VKDLEEVRSTMRLRRSKKTTEFSTMRLEEDEVESKGSTETFDKAEDTTT